MEEKMLINETVEETNETVTEPTDEVIEQEDEEKVEAPTEPVFGKVSGCKKLNIRTKPAVNPNNIATIIDEGTELMIDPDEETAEWYKVMAPNAIEGFCMKKYVTID